ncbi:MAG TPA: SURF1 family protein [Cycloclasticus sp.]|jgi:surfeit locus 1 family protein|nr:SURF1 family protein [Cycloclasticus sp.]
MGCSENSDKTQSANPKVARLISLAIVLSIIGLVLLGNWQLRRLDWKLALIDRVENRVSAKAVNSPTREHWPTITQEKDEYRRVSIQGKFLHEKETIVWAITEHGNGYWILTPLLTANQEVVLVNRGYVPIAAASPLKRLAGQIDGDITVIGLLRISEPNGIPLRDNDPAAEHWYSRDIAAIAQARGLKNVAPYFIDADNADNPGGLPIGGLTLVNHRNSHLLYALTWYGLALLLAIMTVRVIRLERKKP